jgi:5-methyltetrahydropteroyltriglutamate--homocysteine methyltransferase
VTAETRTATARADVVGSLLRPDELLEARRALREGRIGAAEVRAAEDGAVREAIALQERAGVDVVTDGEMRRTSWIASIPLVGEDPSFVAPVTGYAFLDPAQAGQGWIRGWRDAEGKRVERPPRARAIITERLRPRRDIVGDEYGFLKANAHGRSKYSFPAPSYHRVFWHPEYSRAVYPTVDDFLRDVCEYIRGEVIERLIRLGCDYIQMDAPNYGQFYTDPEIRAEFEAEGHDLQANLVADAEIDNAVFAPFEGMSRVTRALHICRGNGPGGIWSAAGGYDVLAPVLFPRLKNVDRLLLEYDTERAGDFSPLRHVLPHATVVLGLLTTKSGALEDATTIEGRIQEATKYVPLERLALSPQCGFNSALGGNPLTPAEQAAKLRLVAEVAHRVWPR